MTLASKTTCLGLDLENAGLQLMPVSCPRNYDTLRGRRHWLVATAAVDIDVLYGAVTSPLLLVFECPANAVSYLVFHFRFMVTQNTEQAVKRTNGLAALPVIYR